MNFASVCLLAILCFSLCIHCFKVFKKDSFCFRRTKTIDGVVSYENCVLKIVTEECVRLRFLVHFARAGVFPLTLKNDLYENENRSAGLNFVR